MMRENRTDVLHASGFEFESQIPGEILYRDAPRCDASAGMAAKACRNRQKKDRGTSPGARKRTIEQKPCILPRSFRKPV